MTIASHNTTLPQEGDEVAVRPARAIRPFYWSVRRELWEHAWLWMALPVAAGLVLLGSLIAMAGLPASVRHAVQLAPSARTAALITPYNMAAVALIVVMLLVSAFYCAGALHGERRDRSLLFWRSLPVPDTTAVLAKACLVIFILPLFGDVIIIATQLVMLIIATVVVWLNGLDAGLLWSHIPIMTRALVLPYGLLTLSFWYAPLFAWLLMVSAWARRVPILWAVGAPLALCGFERIAFNTVHLTDLMKDRLTGSFGRAFTVTADTGSSQLSELDPVKFLTSPDVWIGLILTAAFLAVAIWLRRREPS